MFLPASLIINCFLIQDCKYLSARSALSFSEPISWVIKSRSERLSKFSSTEAKTLSSPSSPVSSALNLKKSQLEKRTGTNRIKLLFLSQVVKYSFLFKLIYFSTIFVYKGIHQ